MKRKKIVQPTNDQIKLLRRTGSPDKVVAEEAMIALAAALKTPLRSALLTGDILSNI